MNEIPRVVFSDSLASAGWGETTIAESAAGPAIGHLGHDSKQQPAVFGGVPLAGWLHLSAMRAQKSV